MSDLTCDDAASLESRLAELRMEHRDLDDAINRLIQNPVDDDLMIRRLKKRKLVLKDRISALEAALQPDEPA